jgi:CheY-like chemotaxis protein
VVEDNEPVRRLMRLLLEAEGFTVLEAGSGAEALALELWGTSSPDARVEWVLLRLLLVDVVLPDGNGVQLSRRLATAHPLAKVLYTAGLGEVLRDFGPPLPGAAFLPKPFTAATLRKAILSLFDG